MQKTPSLEPAVESLRTAPRMVLRTAALACSVLFVPIFIGFCFVWAGRKIQPRAMPPADDAIAALTNKLCDGSVSNVEQLTALRDDFRRAGLSTDEVNLRLWARHVQEPQLLFRVPPPESGKKWNWYLDQKGLFAIAVSVRRDTAGRRTVGMYDLLEAEWVWTNSLPWPDAHEQPYVFHKNLVIQYAKNARRFALEVNQDGQIIHIDTLGAGHAQTTHIMPADPRFPGTPVAAKNGVFFTSDVTDDTLRGYAASPLPGLRDAGTGNALTVFSGNGRLKFTAENGRVSVEDSLTQTVLQRIDTWPSTTNTQVTALLTPHDGSRLTVFLKTDFGGMPPIVREWSVLIDFYAGTIIKNLNADALFTKPKVSVSRQAVSPDRRWQLSLGARNELDVTDLAKNTCMARVPLAALGFEQPIDHLAFLEEGRYVMLRQRDRFWLLDFKLARTYADLAARCAASTNTPPVTATEATATDQLAIGQEGQGIAAPFDADTLSFGTVPDETVPSYFALRAELLAANQAWGYAAAFLDQTRSLQEYDIRAPHVNPFLLARYFLLSNQRSEAKRICRDALMGPLSCVTNGTRMIRYQLQGLLFAHP